MTRTVDLVQGTPEWLDWRRQGIGGSEAPAVMGVSPYSTRLKLWREKTGQPNPGDEDKNKEFIFALGHKTESKIRNEYTDLTGVEMNPVCLVHPTVDYFRASLDGYHDHRGILEAKLVGAKVLAEAKKGIIPEHHRVQMQHQFMVSGADVGDYFCHNGKDNGILLEVRPDKEFIKRLVDAEHEFWRMVTEKIMPEISPEDYLIPDNPELVKLIRSLKETKELMDNAKLHFDQLKETILTKIDHPKIACEGVRIIKVESKGNVDYAKIPELQAVDLEQYRKASYSSWRVDLEKSRKEKPT